MSKKKKKNKKKVDRYSDDYSFLDDLKDPNRKREATAKYAGRKVRKTNQKRPSVTYSKGKDYEATYTDINPFTDVVEIEKTYGLGKGKSYVGGQTSGERASRNTRREVDKINTKAGGGKVKSKFFTGGTVNPSFGTDFDDR